MRTASYERSAHGAVIAALLGAALGGCGSGPAPSPPPIPSAATSSTCPLPLVFAADETRPGWVRLENTGERPLTVFLDRCLWHTHMADIPPGKVRQVRLPGELVAYGDRELRFHAFDSEDPGYRLTYQVPLGTSPIVRVDLAPDRALPEETLTTYELPEGGRRSASGGVVTDSVLGYTSVWGVGGGGVLSWTCHGNRAWLSLSLGRKARGEGPPPVDVRIGRGEWEEVGLWEVVPGGADALLAPLEIAAPLTGSLLAADRASFRVRDRESGWGTYSFDLTGLAASLSGLPCAASVMGGR